MKVFIKLLAVSVSLLTFATTFAAAPAQPPEVTVSPAEKAKIETVVHQYLITKPEVLVEALQVLQRKQFEQAEQTVKKTQSIAASFANALFHQANDPIVGNPNGTVTITEFFDYQCPHCIDMAPVIADISKANPNVRIVFKEFPIRGPISEFAARAALAANKQGKYYLFSHAMLTSKQPLTQDDIFQIAKNVGLNIDQLKKDMADSSIDNQLKANMKLAQDLQLFGTPALFIGKTDVKSNGKINYVPGQLNQNQLQSAINQVR